MQTVLIFIVVLSFLVFIHELGHFLFAKRAGILVREFAIGFGPKIFSRVKGETLYSIRALPLGGSVRMAGEDGEAVEIKTGTEVFIRKDTRNEVQHVYLYPASVEGLEKGKAISADLEDKLIIVIEDEQGVKKEYRLNPKAFIHVDEKNQVQIAPHDRQFGSKTVGQKALTIFAGPLFNIILTVMLFAIYAGMTGVNQHLAVNKVDLNRPAAEAGIQAGDIITAVDGNKITNLTAFSYRLIDAKGKEVVLSIKRGAENLQVPVTPEKKGDLYQIGVYPLEVKRPVSGIWEASTEGVKKTVEWTGLILDGFGKLITGQFPLSSLGGPLQMGSITGKAAEAGFDSLIRWTALLSLNLGIFNLLPIPALDGSRLVFIGIEGIRGRPIHPNKEGMVHFVGFALLMMLMLVVTFNDIKKIFLA